MSAISERSVLCIKSECLSELIRFGTAHLERAVGEFARHYHEERPHQSLRNDLIAGRPDPGTTVIVAHQRVGGLPKHDHNAA